MLFIDIPVGEEYMDGDKRTARVELEHSLVAISKWESKWHVPFLSDADKTNEQLLDYISCMVVHDDDLPYIAFLTEDNLEAINRYLSDEASATTIYSIGPKKRSSTKGVFTSEFLYYQMIVRNIPMECQHWNIQRLIKLIQIWDVYNGDAKHNRMSTKQTIAYYAAENARRQKAMHTKG